MPKQSRRPLNVLRIGSCVVIGLSACTGTSVFLGVVSVVGMLLLWPTEKYPSPRESSSSGRVLCRRGSRLCVLQTLDRSFISALCAFTVLRLLPRLLPL